MRVEHLKTVDGFVAFDLDCPTSAGGTRLAPDVTEHETELLARAMTYKFAVLGVRTGGAKAAIRATPDRRAEVMSRYCAEIRPWVESGRFLTATDLGTQPEDFASLPGGDADELMHSDHDGMPLDAYITGLGVAIAAEVALGGLDGRTVALEGFGKVGGAAALEVTRRGARLVAFSTVHGCVARPEGFDVARLLELRREHGDRLVDHAGAPVRPASELFAIEADVLIPGARPGVIDEETAERARVRVVAPAANVPYTRAGLKALQGRGVPALADFVCNSGATIGYVAGVKSVGHAKKAVEKRVSELTRRSLEHPRGPHAGASEIAERHLRRWVAPEQMPDGPPLA